MSKIKLYMTGGWINIKGILKHYPVSKFPFIFLVGGRGTGKTYGILQELVESYSKFIYLRRSQTEIDECANPEMNPFKTLNHDKGWNFKPEKISKNISAFYPFEISKNQKEIKSGNPIAYALALTTVSNIRGFDASDCSDIFWDEFIAEKHKNQIRGEAEALFNAYETISRNRELLGKPPVRLICAANSNNIFNPIFLSLGVVDEIFDTLQRGENIITNSSRGYVIIVFTDSPISEMKKETALYKLTKGSRFYDMSISNKFENQFFSQIKSISLKEYNAKINCSNFCIYIHKSRKEIYVSRKQAKNVETYRNTDIDRRRAKYIHPWAWSAYCNGFMSFESVQLEAEFVEFFNFI